LISAIAAPQEYTFGYDYVDRVGEILELKRGVVRPDMKRADIASRPVLIIIDDGVPVCTPPSRLPVAISYASHLGMYAQASLTHDSHGKEELTLRRFDILPVIDASVIFSEAADEPIVLGNGKNHRGITSNIVKLVGELFGVNLESNMMGVILLGLQADCKVIASKDIKGMTMGAFEDSLVGRLEVLHQQLNEKYRPEGCDMPPVMLGVVGVGSRNMMRLNPRMEKKVLLK
jgi:hypothetical protein